MSRIKTYKVAEEQLDDLMKALNLTRDDIPRICEGVSASAYGWWRHQGQIPLRHLIAFRDELQRQLKLRSKTDLDRKVENFLKIAIVLMDATGSAGAAASSTKQSALYSSLSVDKTRKGEAKKLEHKATRGRQVNLKDLLKLASDQELIEEAIRRGGTITFGPKKPR